jgi:hypothetical protein
MENPILRAPQIQSLSPNVLPETPLNFTVKLCVDDLALGDEFAMNSAVDVENTMSMVFMELQLIFTFGRGDDGLFHCDDFVSGLYLWLTVPPFCP